MSPIYLFVFIPYFCSFLIGVLNQGWPKYCSASPFLWPTEGFPNVKVKNIRLELFSLNDRLQVGNYFCGCDSNSVPEMVVRNVVVFL